MVAKGEHSVRVDGEPRGGRLSAGRFTAASTRALPSVRQSRLADSCAVHSFLTARINWPLNEVGKADRNHVLAKVHNGELHAVVQSLGRREGRVVSLMGEVIVGASLRIKR